MHPPPLPLSLAARIFSTTMPDGPGVFPRLQLRDSLLTISIVIGMGGPSSEIA